jgi:hypothetical protein
LVQETSSDQEKTTDVMDADEETGETSGEPAGERESAGEGSWSGARLWRRIQRHPAVEGIVETLGPYASPLYFACGVVFDAVTLGRELSIWMLSYVFAYALGVAVCMVIRARRWLEGWRDWVDGALHFCLGATFSALVVLYFRSATYLWSWLTVGLLVGVMVWNEYAAKGRPRRSLVWGVYAASLVMLLNFLLPFAFGTIASFWFYASLALAMGGLYGLRRVAQIPSLSLAASGVFTGLLAVLYLAGAIPPVPLVMRQNIACVNGQVSGGEYLCEGEPTGSLVRWGLASPRVRYEPGERVSVLSAVSAPDGISATLEHRWARWEGDAWKRYDTIEVQMTGGRDSGWRFYSYKRSVKPGRWRVTTAVPDGRVVGYLRFDLEKLEGDERPDREIRKLR